MNTYTQLSADMAARLGLKRLTLGLLAGSFAVNALLAGCLLFKENPVTTVLVPIGINETTHPMSVSKSHVDENYLTLVARDLLSLSMNVTPINVDFNREALLKHVAPSAYGEIDEALKEKARLIKKLHATSLFSIEAMQINAKELTVQAYGFKHHYIGKTETLKQKATVFMRFSFVAGKLQLITLSESDGARQKSTATSNSL